MKTIGMAAVLAFIGAVGAFAAAETKASRGNLKSEPNFLLILGCTVHGDDPCETLKSRIAAAAKYLTEHPRVIAVPCGGIVQKDQTKSEAAVIRDGLIAAGIDQNRIIIEDKSKTTAQNFKNAKRIIEKAAESETGKIAFLSSEYHLLRASLIAKRVGMNIQAEPAKTPKNELIKSYLRELIVFPGTIITGK